MTRRWLRRPLVLALTGSVAAVALAGSTLREPALFRSTDQRPSAPAAALRPLLNSPLAASADAVFAVEHDQEHVLRRPADLSGPWERVTAGGKFQKIAGIAVNGNRVYVTDSADEAVYQVDLQTGERTTLMAEGGLRDPGSIAVAGDVFVADDLTGKVYRVRGSTVSEAVLNDIGGQRPLLLAASGTDLLVVPPDGRILEFQGVGTADPGEPQRPRRQFGTPADDRPLKSTLRRLGSLFIAEPTRIAVGRGVVYVVDRLADQLFAVNLTDGHPIRLVHDAAARTSRAGSVAVNDRSLYVLAGTTLERWPRLVPARVNLRTAGASAAMSLVYDYLEKRHILPFQEVAFDTSIETTLKKHKVLVDDYPAARFDPLVCRWNPGACDQGGRIRNLRQGTSLRVPQLHSATIVDTAPVTLDGKETLGEVADRRVPTEAFRGWTSEERLRDLNVAELAQQGSPTARQARRGAFLTHIEYVRYIVPVLPEDLPPRGMLKNVEAEFSGVRVVSLEEGGAIGQGAGRADQLVPYTELKTQFEAMLARIRYQAAPMSQWRTIVGIAEKGEVDATHPDLAGALLDLTGAPQPGSVATGDPVVALASSEKDHATIIAGLIGSRRSKFEHQGLAPLALLLPIDGNDAGIGDGIRVAQNVGAKLFNISEHFGRTYEPAGLIEMVKPEPGPSRSLFIVAAGNDDREVCGAFRVYPTCWHEERNVLVVSATDETNEGILAGSNWSGTAVHVTAPGNGFYAAGAERRYVPVKGTSFATPLVTAAAALLYYGGGLIDPWLIKQRLVATADPLPGKAANLVLGGRLNIKRALSHLKEAVLSRNGTEKDETQELAITPRPGSYITVRTDDEGDDLQLKMRAVRRVHRQPDGRFRILHVHNGRLELLINVTFPYPKADQFVADIAGSGTQTIELARWEDFVAPAQ